MITILNFFAKDQNHSQQVSVSTDLVGTFNFLVIKDGKIYENKTYHSLTVPCMDYQIYLSRAIEKNMQIIML